MDRYAKPEFGNVVHYVAEDGRCQAAFVAEVGQWVTVETTPRKSYDKSEGRAIRNAEQWFYGDAAALIVVSPGGLAFEGRMECKHGEGSEQAPKTWHWPSRECRP